MTDANDAQAEYWEDVAAGWLDAERDFEILGGPFGRVTLDRLAPVAGERVLDIGCGSGGTTWEIAEEVAPGGAVVGIDIAPAMIHAARTRVATASDVDVTFDVVDAQTAEIVGAPFDAIYSRFGVMFFADPVAAFTNLAAQLRPGGRLAFACWGDLVRNEWMFIPGAAVITATGEFPPMPGPGEPGPFSLADPAEIERILTAAGFSDIAIEPFDDGVDLDATDVGVIRSMAHSIGPVRNALLTADDAMAARIIEEVDEALLAAVADGRLKLTALAHIVTAVRP